jgi:hypothetical protein
MKNTQRVIFSGSDGELNGQPFYRLHLGPAPLAELRSELERRSKRARAWVTLVVTADNPNRLRLKDDPTAEFEARAAPIYLRGDTFRVTGRQGRSCNITMSSDGAAALARKLGEAGERMREWVEIRVPSRKRDLLEIVPDVDISAGDSGEIDAIVSAGARAGSRALTREDFSDWES